MTKPRQRGMRKAYLKRFSAEYINTGQQMDKGNRGYEIARSLPHAATKSIGQPLPVTKGYVIDFERKSDIPRVEVLKQIWQGKFRQGTNHVISLCIQESNLVSLKLILCSEQIFFLKHDKMRKNISRSIMYPSKERAMMACRQNRVCFIETISNTTA